jgi:hypothetical protein
LRRLPRLNAAQRAVLVDKAPDFATLILGGLILGQIIGERPLSIPFVIGALVVWLVTLGAMLMITGDE